MTVEMAPQPYCLKASMPTGDVGTDISRIFRFINNCYLGVHAEDFFQDARIMALVVVLVLSVVFNLCVLLVLTNIHSTLYRFICRVVQVVSVPFRWMWSCVRCRTKEERALYEAERKRKLRAKLLKEAEENGLSIALDEFVTESRKPDSSFMERDLLPFQCLVSAVKAVAQEGKKKVAKTELLGCAFRLDNSMIFPEHLLHGLDGAYLPVISLQRGEASVRVKTSRVSHHGMDLCSIKMADNEFGILGVCTAKISADPNGKTFASMTGLDLSTGKVVSSNGSCYSGSTWGEICYTGSTVGGCSGGVYHQGNTVFAMHQRGGLGEQPNSGLSASLILCNLKGPNESYAWLFRQLEEKEDGFDYQFAGGADEIYIRVGGKYVRVPVDEMIKAGFDLEWEHDSREDDLDGRLKRYRGKYRGKGPSRFDEDESAREAAENRFEQEMELRDGGNPGERSSRKMTSRQTRKAAEERGRDENWEGGVQAFVEGGLKFMEMANKLEAQISRMNRDPYADAGNCKTPPSETPEEEVLEIDGVVVKPEETPEQKEQRKAQLKDVAQASAVKSIMNLLTAAHTNEKALLKKIQKIVQNPALMDEDMEKVILTLSLLNPAIAKIVESSSLSRQQPEGGKSVLNSKPSENPSKKK